MIEKELKIRDICSYYALDIPNYNGSETKQPCVICKRLNTVSGNMTARVSVMQIIYVLSVATFSLFTRTLICIHTALTAV